MTQTLDIPAVLAQIAETARAEYAPGDHLRVRSSGIVHAVTLTPWMAGQTLPGPACMVGVGGWDPHATTPHDGPVTCGRCLRLHSPTPTPADVDQLELFPDREGTT